APLKAGCVFVPLDPETPPKRLAAMIAEVEPQWGLADDASRATLAQFAGVRVISVNALNEAVGAPPVELDPDDLCYIYFTSGSTGGPKGVAGRVKGIDH